MRGVIHGGIGIVSAAVAAELLDLNLEGMGLFAAWLGALAPDLDHPGSLAASRVIPGKSPGLRALVMLLSGIAMVMFYLENRGCWEVGVLGVLLLLLALSKHRGPTHSLLGLVVAQILGSSVARRVGIDLWPFLVGYASHLIADMFTPRGIPLFYPCKTRFRASLRPRDLRGLLAIVILTLVLFGLGAK